MKTHAEILSIATQLQFRDWRFLVGSDGPRPFLQVEFDAPCNDTGGDAVQRGRKWFLSPHMTRSEIVQTAMKAVLTAVEHEAREQFLYRGEAIFGPHFDVDALHRLALDRHRDAREKAAEPEAA